MTAPVYTLDGETLPDLDAWIADNNRDGYGFDGDEIARIRSLTAGEALLLGGGAAAAFILRREA